MQTFTQENMLFEELLVFVILSLMSNNIPLRKALSMLEECIQQDETASVPTYTFRSSDGSVFLHWKQTHCFMAADRPLRLGTLTCVYEEDSLPPLFFSPN